MVLVPNLPFSLDFLVAKQKIFYIRKNANLFFSNINLIKRTQFGTTNQSFLNEPTTFHYFPLHKVQNSDWIHSTKSIASRSCINFHVQMGT